LLWNASESAAYFLATPVAKMPSRSTLNGFIAFLSFGGKMNVQLVAGIS
jgi:hypothetical protein